MLLKTHIAIKLDSYIVVRRDRVKRAKGPVATFIKGKIRHEEITIDEINLEFVAIKLKISYEFYHLSNMYDL